MTHTLLSMVPSNPVQDFPLMLAITAGIIWAAHRVLARRRNRRAAAAAAVPCPRCHQSGRGCVGGVCIEWL